MDGSVGSVRPARCDVVMSHCSHIFSQHITHLRGESAR